MSADIIIEAEKLPLDLLEYFEPIEQTKSTTWKISTKPFSGAHFAVFPPELIETPIKACCPVGGVVLDPFAGSGTTGLVAKKLGREFVGIELNRDYIKMAEARLASIL